MENKKVKEWIEFISTQILMYLVVVGYFITLYYLIEAKEWTTVGILVGVLATAFVTIIGYKWGSSAGSAKKTDILADQQKVLSDKTAQ